EQPRRDLDGICRGRLAGRDVDAEPALLSPERIARKRANRDDRTRASSTRAAATVNDEKCRAAGRLDGMYADQPVPADLRRVQRHLAERFVTRRIEIGRIWLVKLPRERWQIGDGDRARGQLLRVPVERGQLELEASQVRGDLRLLALLGPPAGPPRAAKGGEP